MFAEGVSPRSLPAPARCLERVLAEPERDSNESRHAVGGIVFELVRSEGLFDHLAHLVLAVQPGLGPRDETHLEAVVAREDVTSYPSTPKVPLRNAPLLDKGVGLWSGIAR